MAEATTISDEQASAIRHALAGDGDMRLYFADGTSLGAGQSAHCDRPGYYSQASHQKGYWVHELGTDSYIDGPYVGPVAVANDEAKRCWGDDNAYGHKSVPG